MSSAARGEFGGAVSAISFTKESIFIFLLVELSLHPNGWPGMKPPAIFVGHEAAEVQPGTFQAVKLA